MISWGLMTTFCISAPADVNHISTCGEMIQIHIQLQFPGLDSLRHLCQIKNDWVIIGDVLWDLSKYS